MHSLHTLNVETKLKTKKSYTVLSLGFLQDLSSLVQRPFSSDGQRAAAAALDLGHSQQAELEEDLCRGSKIRKKKKTLPNRTNPQIYNPNSNYRDVQLLLKKKNHYCLTKAKYTIRDSTHYINTAFCLLI